MPSRLTSAADSWRVPATALGLPYQQAIVRAGGVAIAVPPLFDEDSVGDVARDVVSRVDGVCLPGGPDVNPARYGMSDVHPKVFGVRDEHDAIDVALAQAAVEAGIPLLAICRGHQVLNVALGGSLHQHIGDIVGEDEAATHFKQHHDIDVVPGSRTAAAMGTARPLGHCVHHQAIDRLGRGLVVTARRGAVIEGVELPDQWVVGVQWHPEDDAAVDAQQQALFDTFVAAARGEVGARS
jgi:putative glutamine amidotransferase